MWVGVSEVLPTTGRVMRRTLRSTPRVHLCRASPCTEQGEGAHAATFAVLDESATLEELREKGALDWAARRCASQVWRALGLPFRTLWRLLCCCRRGAGAAAGAVQDRLARDPGYESETSEEETPCAASQVKWEAAQGIRLWRHNRA